MDMHNLVQELRHWASDLGFSQIGIAGIDLAHAEPGLEAWLEAGFHGGMHYMAAHGLKRARPAELVPGTLRVITARMDYLPRETSGMANADAGTAADPDWIDAEARSLQDPHRATISIYARGRDYHKVLRSRLQTLAERLAARIGPFGHRVFTDSAPVLEAELATQSGIGWRGKHTLVLAREGGSMFFLGEIYVDLPLPTTPAAAAHCGQCNACIAACPTGAIVAPYRLDARRCISYLTIEHDGPIEPALRPLIGNRVYGCDDCQTACPWNKYARRSVLADFDVREGLADATLLQLWAWTEPEFLRRTQGSAIRRIGWQRWRRNLAVGLGNAWRSSGDKAIEDALQAALPNASELVREHIQWALAQRA